MTRLVPPMLALLLAMLVAGCGEASAATCDRVAARGGSDGAAGTQASPYRTAQKLVGELRAGETGCLRAGTYAEQVTEPFVLSVERGGAEGAPITLRSYPGERARLQGIVTVGPRARHVVLADLDFVGDGTQNTIKIYSADVTVEDSDITNQRRGLSCMILGSNDESGHAAVRTTIRRNAFHDCGSPRNGNHDHGIYVSRASDGQIVDNVFWNPSGYAIQFYPNSQRMLFARNVIDGRGSIRGGVVFGGDDDHVSSGNVVERNVIANAVTYGVTASWEDGRGSGNVARHNCITGARLGALGELEGFRAEGTVEAGDPFLDARRRDYRLKPASPCRALLGQDTAAIVRERQGAPRTTTAAAVRRSVCARKARRKLTRRQRARCARARRARTA